jgi:hypothetical protein
MRDNPEQPAVPEVCDTIIIIAAAGGTERGSAGAGNLSDPKGVKNERQERSPLFID